LKNFSKDAVGELAFAGSLLLLGIIILVDTKNMLVPPGSGSVGPQVFPTIIGIFIIAVSIILSIEILRGNYGQPEGTEFGEIKTKTDWKTLSTVSASIHLQWSSLEWVLLTAHANYFVIC
jgi:putative tricarboxylic transport membrane protein